MNKRVAIFAGVSLLVLVIFGGFLAKEKLMGGRDGRTGNDQVITEEANQGAGEEQTESTSESGKETNGQKAQPESMELGEVKVELTDKGFVPNKVTVKKGTVVKFVNKTSGGMLVASDPHPTHTDYPEFDQSRSGFKGKSEYAFTFSKVGSWGFHDHLDPGMRGTVVVNN